MTKLAHPIERLEQAAELLRNPYLCNHDPAQSTTTAELFTWMYQNWSYDAQAAKGNTYWLRRELQEKVLAIADAIIERLVGGAS